MSRLIFQYIDLLPNVVAAFSIEVFTASCRVAFTPQEPISLCFLSCLVITCSQQVEGRVGECYGEKANQSAFLNRQGLGTQRLYQDSELGPFFGNTPSHSTTSSGWTSLAQTRGADTDTRQFNVSRVKPNRTKLQLIL